MMINRIAVDTNILLYLHDSFDVRKREIAKRILAENPVVPAQVVSEFLNVIRRQLPLSKNEMVEYCAELLKDCQLIPVSIEVLRTSSRLISKYNFQIFDAVIVAAALSAGCSILYSEDMQDGLLVDGIRICNPFR